MRVVRERGEEGGEGKREKGEKGEELLEAIAESNQEEDKAWQRQT